MDATASELMRRIRIGVTVDAECGETSRLTETRQAKLSLVVSAAGDEV